MTKSSRDANHLLASENDRSLNEAFYRARPHAYFNQRLEALILVAGKSEELQALLAGGVTVGPLKAGGTPVPGRTDEERAELEEDRERYIIADTEVLLHHAAETLLRLYHAHENLPPCPWLKMAEERSFAAFKGRVDKLGEDLAAQRRHDELATVFFGTSDRAALHPEPREDLWHEGLENLVKWMSWYAQHFLDANVYNAAKHGLAVQPGEAAFQLGDDELISRSGPAIEYLEVRDEHGRRRWHRTTQWVDVGRSLAYVFMACRLIKRLMDVARARYTDQPLRSLDLFVEPRFEKTLTGEGIEFTKLSFGLLYYRDPDEPEEPA